MITSICVVCLPLVQGIFYSSPCTHTLLSLIRAYSLSPSLTINIPKMFVKVLPRFYLLLFLLKKRSIQATFTLSSTCCCCCCRFLFVSRQLNMNSKIDRCVSVRLHVRKQTRMRIHHFFGRSTDIHTYQYI